jgi:hypothetical protein
MIPRSFLWIAALLVAAALFVFAYDAAFAFWMTSHPVHADPAWAARFYRSSAVALLLLLLQLALGWKIVTR